MAPRPEIERFRDYLLMLARSRLGPAGPLDPSDVVQQSLLTAHAQSGQFRGSTDGELAAWLGRILAGTLADALRAMKRAKRDAGREVALDDSSARCEAWLAAEQDSPSESARRHEAGLRLADALARLPDAQREAVTLRHLHGLSLDAIAGQLGRTPTATAGLLKRGLARLRELLDDGDRP